MFDLLRKKKYYFYIMYATRFINEKKLFFLAELGHPTLQGGP